MSVLNRVSLRLSVRDEAINIQKNNRVILLPSFLIKMPLKVA